MKLTKAQLKVATNDETQSVNDYYRERQKAVKPDAKARLAQSKRESVATLAKRRRGVRTSG